VSKRGCYANMVLQVRKEVNNVSEKDQDGVAFKRKKTSLKKGGGKRSIVGGRKSRGSGPDGKELLKLSNKEADSHELD